MAIPLANFIDRSNLQVPLGLMTSSGLTSAMRNPLYSNFSGQIILDFRPRDNIQYSGLSDEKRRVTFSTFGGGGVPAIVAGKGLNLSSAPTGAQSFFYPIDRMNSQADTASTPYNSDTSTVVMLAAIQITGYRGANLADPFIGYARLNNPDYNTTASGFGTGDNVPMYARVPNEAGATSQIMRRRYQRDDVGFEDDFVDATVNTAASWNKWILVQLCKQPGSPETFNMRMLGGQWGDAGVPDSQTLTDDGTAVTWATYDLMLPISSTVVLGFMTVAQYAGNNGAGVNGTGVGHIDWTIFDQNHVCKDLSITGNRISWTCTGEVAWQIKVGGIWQNSSGGEDYDYYGTRDVETSSVIDTVDFTAIRPVLRNYGTMYADSNSVLSSVTVASFSEIIDPSYTQNIKLIMISPDHLSRVNNPADKRTTRFKIIGHELSDRVEWQIFAQQMSDEDDPIYTVQTPIESESLYFQSNDIDYIDIVLPEKKSLKIRVRLFRDSEWSSWSDFLEFKTKAYNVTYFIPESVRQRQSLSIINTSVSDTLSFSGV